jgi:hypothetical protein
LRFLFGPEDTRQVERIGPIGDGKVIEFAINWVQSAGFWRFWFRLWGESSHSAAGHQRGRTRVANPRDDRRGLFRPGLEDIIDPDLPLDSGSTARTNAASESLCSSALISLTMARQPIEAQLPLGDPLRKSHDVTLAAAPPP